MTFVQTLRFMGAALGLAALLQAEPARPSAPGAIEPKADTLLRKMSNDLASMRNFRFDSSQVMEVVTKEGEKIQSLAESGVMVQRPNKLRATRMGPNGEVNLYYDGQNISVYGKRDNLYATAKAPGTLDAAIDFARDGLSLDTPGADLLYGDVYAALMEDVVSGRYLGAEVVDNRTCHHLAYRGHDTDWQLWVADGPRALPCRYVITSKKVTGEPQFTVALSNWKEEPSFATNTFVFAPPRDAGKIDFVTVEDMRQK